MRLAALAIATAGLGIAGYLTAVHYGGGEPACFIAHGCAIVQRSTYAKLAGVPVALLGLLGYVTILAALAVDTPAAKLAAAGVAIGGALFSAWLTVVEITRLHAICAWCVASAACMVLLAALTAARQIRAG